MLVEQGEHGAVVLLQGGEYVKLLHMIRFKFNQFKSLSLPCDKKKTYNLNLHILSKYVTKFLTKIFRNGLFSMIDQMG